MFSMITTKSRRNVYAYYRTILPTGSNLQPHASVLSVELFSIVEVFTIPPCCSSFSQDI